MKRIVEDAAQVLAGEVSFRAVNVDEEPALVRNFGVRGTPTFVLIRGGEVVDSFTGVVGSRWLVDRVREQLKPISKVERSNETSSCGRR
jgi:thioredoxin 1